MPHPDFEWSQDSDKKLEIRIPLAALNGPKPSDIDVVLKEKDIIAVSVSGTVVLQRRLHDDVTIDNWLVEDGTHVVIECVKNDADSWPCLLRLPLPPTDSRLLTAAEIDNLLRTEMPRLPKDDALDAESANGAAAAAPIDPDELLDDAFEEITIAEANAAAATAPHDDAEPHDSLSTAQLASAAQELELTEKEFKEFDGIMQSLKEKVASEDESVSDSDREQARERVELLAKMIELSKDVRRLRSKRPTMDLLLQILHIEIWKGRLNHGAVGEHEVEAFANDEERAMSATELLQAGLKHMESNNIDEALHCIRLAAIHHNHPVSTCLLQRLYTQFRVLPKAAYFVFRRALMDDLEPSTNLIVGEFVDKGMPLFPPYMALAVHFYQRAALVGSTHAMLTLANTFKQGALNASPAGEELRKANSDDDRFLAWLQAAEDRGSPRAYFIRASLFLSGECGVPKSYAAAKQYIDRVKRTEPSILSKAPGLEQRLNQLKAEEEVKARGAAGATGSASINSASLPRSAPASNPQSPTDSMGSRTGSGALTAPATGGASSAANRLAALERTSGGGAMANMEANPRRGMLSKGGRSTGNSKWRSFFEKSTKWAVGVYFAYCVLFPARVIIAPQAFAVMATLMDVVGLSGASAPAPRGGMLML